MPWFAPLGRWTLVVRAAMVEPRHHAPSTDHQCQQRQRRRKCRRHRERPVESAQTAPTSTSIAPEALLGGIAQPYDIAVAMGVATDSNSHSAKASQAPHGSSVVAPVLCLLEPDPLAEAMCAGDGPPALAVSFDPMLEELLAVAFVMSCFVAAAASPGSAEATLVVAVSSHQPLA